MQFRSDSIIDAKRLYIVFGCFVLFLVSMVGRLWYLQILKGQEFVVASERNRVREVTKPAPRGLIFDRDGIILLSNRPFFDLVVIPQYLQDKEKTFQIISELFHIPMSQIERRLKEAEQLPKFVPIRIKQNLTIHEVAMVESNKFFLPGVDVDTAPRRDYTRNESAHLLGYLGEVTSKELDSLNSQNRNYQYRIGSTIGKMGVEKKYEQFLRGVEGKEYLQVDAYGRLQSRNSLDFGLYTKKQAQRGNDVYLTVDNDLQRTAVDAFRNKNGAVVALNPQTGEVLAYLSNPNFDLNMYQEGLSQEDWQSLQTNPFKPLLDKVSGGGYPPASTYKGIVALAGLEEKLITPERTFNCPGYFTLGNGRWKCHLKTGHGYVNMRKALEVSCDVYFYQLGNILGIDRIAKWGKLFGFGERTDLGLNMEVPGINPTIDWKLRTFNTPWTQGETINVSIGQGAYVTTPLQVINSFAALGNGGKLYRPFLLDKVVNAKGEVVAQEKPYLIREIPLNPENLRVVQAGLVDVVEGINGTGKRVKVPGFTVAGKTGTAQNASLKKTAGREGELSFRSLDHAWFVGYSPAVNPEIVVVALSEYDGGGGGAEAGPIAQKIFEAYWRKKHPEKFVQLDQKKAAQVKKQ